MELNNMVSVFYNFDHDGDNMVYGAVHSKQAKQEAHKMHIKHSIEFEHKDSLLLDYEHEMIYSAYTLTKLAIDHYDPENNPEILKFKNYKDFRENYFTFENLKNSLYQNLIIELPEYSGTMLTICINRSLQLLDFNEEDQMEIFYNPEENEDKSSFIFSKKNLNKFMYEFFKIIKDKGEELTFWDRAHELGKFILEFGSVTTEGVASFDLRDFDITSEEVYKYKENLIQVEPYLAFQQNMILFNDYIRDSIKHQKDNILNKVFDSGARLKSVQLLKAASNTGIPTDIYGKAFPRNIENSLLDGLNQQDYFQTGDSARLALMQRQDAIPKGGELQRKFFYSTGILKFRKDIDDCQANIDPKDQKTFTILVKDKDHLKALNHRYYIDEENNELKVIDLDDKSREEEFLDLIGKKIRFRAPQKCQVEDFGICKTCFGKKTPTSKNVGASLGSYIAESIIQSVLRTHHFGGAFIADENYKVQDVLRRSKIINPDTIYFKSEDDFKVIEDYLLTKYEPEHIEFQIIEPEDEYQLGIKIIVHTLPFNDDSVKVLKNIVSLIDKNRENPDPNEIYQELVPIISQNGILSIYFELILSLIFYDEDGVLIKYTDKPIANQIVLKSIIEQLDPKLSIFYNFSDRAISNVYKAKYSNTTNHMYNEILDLYY